MCENHANYMLLLQKPLSQQRKQSSNTFLFKKYKYFPIVTHFRFRIKVRKLKAFLLVMLTMNHIKRQNNLVYFTLVKFIYRGGGDRNY